MTIIFPVIGLFFVWFILIFIKLEKQSPLAVLRQGIGIFCLIAFSLYLGYVLLVFVSGGAILR
jgi:hypothetical protein